MLEDNLNFLHYFVNAHRAVLSSRESYIVDLRYGLTGNNPCTYALIGLELGVSRERIRQLLNRAHRKIFIQGHRSLKNSEFNTPCAELLMYLRAIIRPEDNDSVNRLIDLAQVNLSWMPLKTHSIPLLTYLTYSDTKTRTEKLDIASKIIREFARKLKKCKQSSKLYQLLAYTIYLQKTQIINSNNFHLFTREREVSMTGEGYAGNFYSQKLNRLVQYESNLEFSFLLTLETLDDVVFYQEQPLKIAYKFEGDTFSYYPDLLLVLKNGQGMVVEIKPVFKMGLKRNLNKWSALKAYCDYQGLGLLVTDGKYAIQQIQKHQIKVDFANAVLNKLQDESLDWYEYKEIKEKYCPSNNDFIALILNNKLVWKLSPFYLGS